jgi:hypothetical protein
VQSLLEPRYYSMSGKYSIECWVKFNNFNPQGIFSYNRYLSTDTEVRENGFSLRVKNSKFNFKVGYWSKREVESVPLVNIVSGNWFHLVVMVNDYSPEPVVITWPRCRTLL